MASPQIPAKPPKPPHIASSLPQDNDPPLLHPFRGALASLIHNRSAASLHRLGASTPQDEDHNHHHHHHHHHHHFHEGSSTPAQPLTPSGINPNFAVGSGRASPEQCVAPRRLAADERRLSELINEPRIRSMRLIGRSNPRYQWERYWKTESELRGMTRPLRVYYERINNLIQQYIYIDRLLDSSRPYDILDEYDVDASANSGNNSRNHNSSAGMGHRTSHSSAAAPNGRGALSASVPSIIGEEQNVPPSSRHPPTERSGSYGYGTSPNSSPPGTAGPDGGSTTTETTATTQTGSATSLAAKKIKRTPKEIFMGGGGGGAPGSSGAGSASETTPLLQSRNPSGGGGGGDDDDDDDDYRRNRRQDTVTASVAALPTSRTDEAVDVDVDVEAGHDGESSLLKPEVGEVGWLDDGEVDSGSRFVTVAIWINFVANAVLLAAKIVVIAWVPSMSVLASLVDAGLDFLSTAIVWLTSKLISQSQHDQYHYPVGRRRLEPVGVLVFSVIMITSFFQVSIQCLERLLSPDRELVELGAPAITILAFTVVIKGAVWIYYRLVKNSSVRALADDAKTDVIFNLGSILFPIVGFYARVWWLDALGGMLLSVVVIFNWTSSSLEHIRNLTGFSALPDQRNLLLYLTMRFATTIRQIQNLRAYHAGDKLFVEVDIVLDPTTPLRDSHDLSEVLTYFLESVPFVDRAFVHVDYASYHAPTHLLQGGDS